MSNIIQLLPDHVANQIAAGEVVQRPASVVKELMENAIDAKATDIKLIIKDAGKTLIQVVDNGLGMNVTDARLCFERHATSKIRLAEDLFALHTKGFRGEALASIAAIAHVELKTKQDQEDLGTHITIEGSKFVSQDVAVLPKGTSFLVKNLFFNIPARRNFLKSETVEMRHIFDEFQRVALAHPNIYFTLLHNGSETFNLPQSNLRQRIVGIFGGKTNEKLIPVTEKTELVSISGFIGKPEFAKKSRSEQFLFVNNRFIKSGYLHHAIMNAYEGILKVGHQPSYFIYLEVPPHTIDINIHPTKTEVKFDDEHAIYAILRATIKHSLGQFNIAPALDFELDNSFETPYDYKNKTVGSPAIQVDANFNPFAKTNSFKTSEKSQGNYKEAFAKPTNSWDSLYTNLRQDAFESKEIEFESEPTISSLFNDNAIEKATSKSYQIHKKYIVSAIKSGMLLVDQNKAHQRILYEQFLTNITVKQASSQHLIFPLELFYSTDEVAFIKELQPSLENIGFIFSEIGKSNVQISGIPVVIQESEAWIVIEELIHNLQNQVPENNFSLNDGIAKSMAKSLAVKTGTFLTEIEQDNLVNGLFACKEPTISPFNKPTFITLSVEDIDKKFAL